MTIPRGALTLPQMAISNRSLPAYEREYRLAEHLFARGEIRRALPHFRRAQLLDPAFPKWRLRIGQCQERLGSLEEAYESFRGLIDPGLQSIETVLRREILQAFTNLCHRLNREQEVTASLGDHPELVRETPALLYNLGLAHYKCRRFPEAQSCFDSLKESFRNHAAGYIGRAILHCHFGEFDRALQELHTGRQSAPHDLQIVENLALVQMKMGNPLGAVTVLRAASELPGAARNAKFSHLLGMAHLRLGDLGKAEGYLRQSLEFERTADALRDLGWLFVAKGNYAESIEFLKEALVVNPNDVWAKVDLAIAYFKQGVMQDALALFNEVRSVSQVPEVNKLLDDLARLIALSSPR